LDNAFLTIDSSTNITIENVNITDTQLGPSRAINILSSNIFAIYNLNIDKSIAE
jgi:hypothetical protein